MQPKLKIIRELRLFQTVEKRHVEDAFLSKSSNARVGHFRAATSQMAVKSVITRQRGLVCIYRDGVHCLRVVNYCLERDWPGRTGPAH